jgi:hypothetical protein
VSPKRGDRVPPPVVAGEWEVRFGTSEAAKGWESLCHRAAGNTKAAWALMRVDPRPPVDGRHHPLKYDLATRTIQGHACEQWQIEVTGAGRIWYAIDDERRTVWVTLAATGHPKATE